MVESKPGVARHTLCSAVHGTMHAGLWDAIPARAYVRYSIITNINMKTSICCALYARIPSRTNTLGIRMVEGKPGVTRRALHGTVRGASSPRCSHAIVTRTTISYKSEQHMSVRSQCACIGFDTQ